jgi:rhamnosyltransferase
VSVPQPSHVVGGVLPTQAPSSDTSGRAPPLAAVVRPRILVLVAAYNGSRWIREQLESILVQEHVDVRIVVRDDCSTDRTCLEVGRFSGDDRVRISRGAARTGSAARNFLALIRENAADEFDFVAFSDQDDIWNRDKLARASRVLTENHSAGYSSATIAARSDGREWVLRQVRTSTASDFLFEGAGQGCTFVLRAEFYERIRRFVTEHRELTQRLHYHDWGIYAVARAWRLQWSFDPEPCMKYRQHSGNDTGARGTVGAVAKRVSLIRRGWYRTQLRTIGELCSVADPSNPTVAAWRSMFIPPDSWSRRLRVARFCLRGGRRRRLDNLMLVLSALAGWI